jgi:membrane protease YdiL (CAAX protease family)
MELFGPGFRAGLRTAAYRPYNPAGLRAAILIFILLVAVDQIVLQGGFASAIAAVGATDWETFKAGLVRGALLSLFPASLLTVLLAWAFARRHGADPREIVALRPPALGVLGWVAVVAGFCLVIAGASAVLIRSLGIPDSSSGEVEKAVMQLSDDRLYGLVVAGVVIGAPLAEEFVFRGQIFAALAQTRIGFVGSAIVTSAMWAALHISEPAPFVGLIFLMGLILSWLLVRFGSLWVTIVCHCAWNAIATITLYTMAPQ